MANVPKAVHDAFYEGRRSSDVPFCVNDPLMVIKGNNAGRCAAVISIESVDVQPDFLVEFGDTGEDAALPVNALRLISDRANEDTS